MIPGGVQRYKDNSQSFLTLYDLYASKWMMVGDQERKNQESN